MKGPRQAGIDVVALMREVKSRAPSDLPGDVVALEIEVAAAGDIIDRLTDQLAAYRARVRALAIVPYEPQPSMADFQCNLCGDDWAKDGKESHSEECPLWCGDDNTLQGRRD
jgi:hypothetical protein